MNINKETYEALAEAVSVILSEELSKLKSSDNSTDKDALVGQLADEIMRTQLLIAVSSGETRTKAIQTLAHYEAALASLTGIESIRSYKATLNVIGRTIAAVLKVTASSFI